MILNFLINVFCLHFHMSNFLPISCKPLYIILSFKKLPLVKSCQILQNHRYSQVCNNSRVNYLPYDIFGTALRDIFCRVIQIQSSTTIIKTHYEILSCQKDKFLQVKSQNNIFFGIFAPFFPFCLCIFENSVWRNFGLFCKIL